MGEISKLVPEIFYDIIGRMIPGLAGLVVWSYVLDADVPRVIQSLYVSAGASESAVLFGLTAITVAYAIGHLVSPLSAAAHSHVLPQIFPTSYRVLKDAAIGGRNAYPGSIAAFFHEETAALLRTKDGEASAAQYRRITFLWYDWIRLRNPTAGTRLAKIRAEYRMLESLYIVFAVGLVFAALVGIASRLGYSARPVPLLAVLALVVCLSLATWAAARLFQTFQFAVINHYYQLNTMPRLSASRRARAGAHT
jgi:hypothetical protein